MTGDATPISVGAYTLVGTGEFTVARLLEQELDRRCQIMGMRRYSVVHQGPVTYRPDKPGLFLAEQTVWVREVPHAIGGTCHE